MPGHRPASGSASVPAPRDEARRAPTLAHMVIFNPTLARKPSKTDKGANKGEPDTGDGQEHKGGTGDEETAPDSTREEEPTSASTIAPSTGGTAAATRDRDLEDDLREAAQIVFYTAHEIGVSRDRMLRQVGLAKGLMGFADMVAPRHDTSTSASAPTYWAVHAQHQRLIVYAPEPNWYIYICISLPRETGVSATPSAVQGGGAKHSDKDKDKDRDAKAEYVRDAPDSVLVAGLQRGYDDFCLRHGSLAAYLPPTARTAGALEGFWTRFALAYEAAYVDPGPPEPILTWLGGWPATNPSDALVAALAELASESGTGSCGGVLTPSGPLGVSSPLGSDRDAAALIRFLLSKLGSVATAPAAPKPAPKPERAHLGFGFGRRRAAEPARPASAAPSTSTSAGPAADATDRRTSWGLSPLSWVGLGSAPASRSASPMPPPPPPPETKASVTAEKEPKVPAVAPAAAKPRWPSFGAFGDAMGNVGAALGLAPSPKPGTHGDRAASPADRPDETPGDRVSNKPGNEPGDKRSDTGDKPDDVNLGDVDDSKSDHVAEVAAEEGDKAPTNEPEMARAEAALQPGQGTEETSLSEETTPRADADADAPAETTGEETVPAPSLPSASPPGSTHSTASALPAPAPTDDVDVDADADADAASIMTHTTAQSVASDLAAAAASDVELPWSPAQVYISGTQKTVHWVIRERMLVFVLGNDTDAPAPPTPPALGVFAAARGRRGHERGTSGVGTRGEKEHGGRDRAGRDRDRAADARPQDTTVYHALPNVTSTAGPLDPSDAGTLAALRTLTAPGGIAPVSEVYAQTPSGRFVVAKRVDAPAPAGQVQADTDATPTAETPSSSALFTPSAPVPQPSPSAPAPACAAEELFGITARRDASLTDAERVVREFALVHPQFG